MWFCIGYDIVYIPHIYIYLFDISTDLNLSLVKQVDSSTLYYLFKLCIVLLTKDQLYLKL